MSQFQHNPENEGAIRKMRDEGLKPAAIARALGITRSTVYWWFDRWMRLEPLALIDDGPAAVDRPTCRVCHGSSATWDGHDGCTGRGRLPAVRQNRRRAIA